MTKDEVNKTRERILSLKKEGFSREAIAETLALQSGVAEVIAYELGLILYESTDELGQALDELWEMNPKALQDYTSGKEQAINQLIGIVKKSHPNLDVRLIKKNIEIRGKTI